MEIRAFVLIALGFVGAALFVFFLSIPGNDLAESGRAAPEQKPAGSRLFSDKTAEDRKSVRPEIVHTVHSFPSISNLSDYLASKKVERDTGSEFPYTPVLKLLKVDETLNKLLENVMVECFGDAARERQLFELIAGEKNTELKQLLLYALNDRADIVDKAGLDRLLVEIMRDPASRDEVYAAIGSCALNIAIGVDARRKDVVLFGQAWLRDSQYSDELVVALADALLSTRKNEAMNEYLQEFLMGTSDYSVRASISDVQDVLEYGSRAGTTHADRGPNTNSMPDSEFYLTLDSNVPDYAKGWALTDKCRLLLSQIPEKNAEERGALLSSMLSHISEVKGDENVRAICQLISDYSTKLNTPLSEVIRIHAYKALPGSAESRQLLLQEYGRATSALAQALAAAYILESAPPGESESMIDLLKNLRPDRQVVVNEIMDKFLTTPSEKSSPE